MDERYPFPLADLEREATAKPNRLPPPSRAAQLRHRRELCGTASLEDLESGGAHPGSRQRRRLLEVIRTWRA